MRLVGHRQLAVTVRVVLTGGEGCDCLVCRLGVAVAYLGKFVLGPDDLRLHASCDTEADHQNQPSEVGGNGTLSCLPDAAVAGDCRRW